MTTRCLHLGLCWMCAFCTVSCLQWAMAAIQVPTSLRTVLLTGVLVPLMILCIGPLTAGWARRLAQALERKGLS